MSHRKVICIVGPTGVGKSEIAFHLAKKYDGIIINADSRQLYQGVPIITAQPTVEERSLIPHKLYACLELHEKISAGRWVTLAAEQLDSVCHTKIPLLVGGTGLYLRALFEGIVTIPPISTELSVTIEKQAEEKGISFLYDILKVHDPLYANSIHPNDRQRVLRALMVFYETGKTFTWWHQQVTEAYPATVLKIGIKIPLIELTPLLEKRIDKMFAQGAIEEVITTYKRYLNKGVQSWSGIGYMELLGAIKGEYTYNEAKERWLKNTRSYAKRQLTWFNADKRIIWFCPDQLEDIQKYIENWLRQE